MTQSDKIMKIATKFDLIGCYVHMCEAKDHPKGKNLWHYHYMPILLLHSWL